MKEQIHNQQCKTTKVCINRYNDRILDGCMYHYDTGVSIESGFRSTMEFLKRMELWMTQMNYPNTTSCRVFQKTQGMEEITNSAVGFRNGKVATFVIQVLFRQHTSWQGTVTWCEGERQESFRSVLELLMLMDSAMNVGSGE